MFKFLNMETNKKPLTLIPMLEDVRIPIQDCERKNKYKKSPVKPSENNSEVMLKKPSSLV